MPIKIKYVAQKHEYGCAIACLSMITGINYDEIEKKFQANFDKKGLDISYSIKFLIDNGFDVCRKEVIAFSNIEKAKARLLIPFANIHLLSMQPYVDSKTNHAVVMDSKGKIYDPHIDNKKFNVTELIKKWYGPSYILGLWRV